MIDDETTLINDVHIEGYLYGRNWGHCGTLALFYTSNCSTSNVTVNV